MEKHYLEVTQTEHFIRKYKSIKMFKAKNAFGHILWLIRFDIVKFVSKFLKFEMICSKHH